MDISIFFANFQQNQIENCSIQIKKMKDGIFSFQLKKITSAKCKIPGKIGATDTT